VKPGEFLGKTSRETWSDNLPMTFDDKGLGGEFLPAGEDHWRKAVDRDLLG